MPHKIVIKFTILSLLYLFTLYGCKKQKPSNPIDQLPPATDTGANTFGCLVNGQAVVIHHLFGDLSPAFGCQYQLIYPTVSGYTLNVWGEDQQDGCHSKTVGVFLDSVQLGQNTYTLNTGIDKQGNRGHAYIANGCSPLIFQTFWTDSTRIGQLTITHFDQQKQIVSGTFYFDAVEATSGDTVHVTDGRFDMNYTQ